MSVDRDERDTYGAEPSRQSCTSIRVRYADTDKMGIAYNGVYLTWFEIGRTELLRDTGVTYNDIEKAGYHLPLREAGVTYYLPAEYDDLATIVTYVESQRGVRIRFHYDILLDGTKLAEGFTEHVFTDSNLRPVKPPDGFRDLEKRFGKHIAYPENGDR